MTTKADIKVVLLGAPYTGKSCLVEKFLNDKFTEGQKPTVAAAFGSKAVKVGSSVVTLGIWDTAGSERYESLSKMYYRGAGAAIVCYDITNHETFAKVRFWVSQLKENEKDCVIYLVGTKIDLILNDSDRDVPMEEVESFSDEIKAKIFETSAKTGKNVHELFETVAADYLERKKTIKNPSNNGGGGIVDPNKPKNKGKCC
ncbi:ras-related protein rab-24 [Anaeramoeba ignava]|uniref:Ras-related protein rab-24 n=1 Tax=Anaeramoeba ignava TaxID=1746090 RepID=A0A9Q0LR98_ANAIG|nr:ras-related protein rab-24 [Anaeramoeba ignava]|eukprot:Anaeramoba_ignava/a613532_114.p1 GENE.a613532_114~~a613532_114.p1  ORF type:complete len:201 (-),score=56.10 a613532_114:29-631(-)